MIIYKLSILIRIIILLCLLVLITLNLIQIRMKIVLIQMIASSKISSSRIKEVRYERNLCIKKVRNQSFPGNREVICEQVVVLNCLMILLGVWIDLLTKGIQLHLLSPADIRKVHVSLVKTQIKSMSSICLKLIVSLSLVLCLLPDQILLISLNE